MALISIVVPVAKRVNRLVLQCKQLEKLAAENHAYDFEFIFQEKYKIAKDRPGSGNTKNIGSVTNIEDLKNGTGTFSKLGVKIFDDYWINYLTKDMAKKIDLPKPPYNNIEKYMKFRNIEEIK